MKAKLTLFPSKKITTQWVHPGILCFSCNFLHLLSTGWVQSALNLSRVSAVGRDEDPGSILRRYGMEWVHFRPGVSGRNRSCKQNCFGPVTTFFPGSTLPASHVSGALVKCALAQMRDRDGGRKMQKTDILIFITILFTLQCEPVFLCYLVIK